MITPSHSDKNALSYGDLPNWIKCLPEEYKEVSWASCKDLPQAQVEFGIKWATEWPLKSLYLHGDWGCGKTTFSFAAIRQVMKNCLGHGYFWPNYITGDGLERLLLEAIKSESGDAYKIETYVESDLLFIDDLDKANPSDRFKRQLFSIINGRMIAKRPTIITSNCQANELASVLDGAILSRMNEVSKWKVIKFRTPDLRKKKAGC